MTDELDDFEDEIEGEEAIVDELVDEAELSDADEVLDIEAERDETPFNEHARPVLGRRPPTTATSTSRSTRRPGRSSTIPRRRRCCPVRWTIPTAPTNESPRYQ